MKVTVDMVEKDHLRTNLPTFRVGDQIRVTLKIVEGDNERLQAFEGTVIRISGRKMRSTALPIHASSMGGLPTMVVE